MRALNTSHSHGTGSLRVPQGSFPSSEATLWLWPWHQDSSSAAGFPLEVQRPEGWAGTGPGFLWPPGRLAEGLETRAACGPSGDMRASEPEWIVLFLR